jgi:hypothetical protein
MHIADSLFWNLITTTTHVDPRPRLRSPLLNSSWKSNIQMIRVYSYTFSHTVDFEYINLKFRGML